MMKNIINIPAILCCIGLLSSCTKQFDYVDGPLRKGDVQINLQLSSTTTETDPEENHIANIMVFTTLPDENQNNIIEMVLNIDPNNVEVSENAIWNNSSKTLTINDMKTPEIPRNIYVVANHKFDIEVGDPQTKLTDAFTTITGSIAAPTTQNPLLMSGSKAMHIFKNDKELNIDLERQVAKIELTLVLSEEFATQFAGVAIGDDAELQALNVPAQSYIFNRNSTPSTTNMLNYDMQKGLMKDNEWTTTLYLYENIITDQSNIRKPTSLHFNMPFKLDNGVEASENHYEIELETSDDMHKNNTKRNNIYRLRGTINGFGSKRFDSNYFDSNGLGSRGLDGTVDGFGSTSLATPVKLDVELRTLPWNGIDKYGDR